MDNLNLHNHKLITQLRDKLHEVRKIATTTDTGPYDAIDQLETDIGRALLKLHAVIEVLVDKGLMTQAEIDAKSQVLDGVDGTVDGQLHPGYFRSTEENARRLTTQAYLHQLQSKHFESPTEYLAKLEEKAKNE